MSRIGLKVINVPEDVTVNVAADHTVTVKGPKGELSRQFSDLITVNVEGNEVKCVRANDAKHTKQLHGTTRALIANMVEGVKNGFEKNLEIVGIGYRAQMKGNKLVLNVGFSHPVEYTVPEGVSVEVPDATTVKISGIDKQIVGQFAAVVRAAKKPEPYGGKGVRYENEHVRRKEGKTAAAKG